MIDEPQAKEAADDARSDDAGASSKARRERKARPSDAEDARIISENAGGDGPSRAERNSADQTGAAAASQNDGASARRRFNLKSDWPNRAGSWAKLRLGAANDALTTGLRSTPPLGLAAAALLGAVIGAGAMLYVAPGASSVVDDATETRLTARLNRLESRLQPREADAAERAELNERLDALTAALANSESRMTELESALAAASGAPDAQAMARIDQLESAVQDARAQADERAATAESAVAALREDMARLGAAESRIEALETESETRIYDRASIGAALSVLGQAVVEGGSYAEALATLEGLAGVTAEPALADAAAEGVASLARLSREFDVAARRAISAIAGAAPESDADESLADSLSRRLSSMITIRRLDEAEGGSPSAILSRAEARLEEGDVAAALAELENLPAPGLEAMADWIAEARRRQEAKAALDRLRLSLLAP